MATARRATGSTHTSDGAAKSVRSTRTLKFVQDEEEEEEEEEVCLLFVGLRRERR
jgi:hypothetical protein